MRDTPRLDRPAPPARAVPDPRNMVRALGNVLAKTRAHQAPPLSTLAAYQAEARQRERNAADAALKRLRQARAAAAESAPPPSASTPSESPATPPAGGGLVDQAERVRGEFEAWELAEWLRLRQAQDAATVGADLTTAGRSS